MSRDDKSDTGNRRRTPLAIVYAIVMFNCFLQSGLTYADSVLPDRYRTGQSLDGFADATQIAAAGSLRPPRRLKAYSPALAIGANATSDVARTFASRELVRKGRMLPQLDRTLPVCAVAEAYRPLANNEIVGSVVLLP